MFELSKPYDRAKFISFLEKDFLPDDFVITEESISVDFSTTYCNKAIHLGHSKCLNLDVYEIQHSSNHDARVGISKDAFQLLLRKSYNNRALMVFVPEGSNQYRFSLIQIEAEVNDQTARIKRSYSNPRRYSFLLGENAHIKTPEQYLLQKGKLKPKDGDYFKDLQERFSVEVLTKEFYRELSNWYFWAIKKVTFPNDINDDSDNDKYNTENIIRLITRLIFVWFIKQKELVSPDLFNPEVLKTILKDFEPESPVQHQYYRAIIQNLFFATLNQEIGKRKFAENSSFVKNRGTYNIKNLYRYENEFLYDTSKVLHLFCEVPFLNGGLFECLDDKIKDKKTLYWDGFSREKSKQAIVPNELFFAKETIVDISKEYNNRKMQSVKVTGIIEILNKYNFTVEENTPVEIEVALDPELLGKVFENLLGAYNPETQETARKQTGSFYTPREIVTYMVNESLIAYYQTKVPDVGEENLRALFSYEDKSFDIPDVKIESLIKATFECKILDPACGSGAFPMGILQQMVHILSKLDPNNSYWSKLVLDKSMQEFDDAEKDTDEDKLVLQDEIYKTFETHIQFPDYTRKLYLIENCIYGVDIQSIAVQISKLRFFISLICEQRRNNNPELNYGIRPLPNLETKFVAANTLIGIEKPEEDVQYLKEDQINHMIKRLNHLRHRQFSVTNASKKKELRKKDEALRHDIVNEVARLYKLHADENLNRFKMQLKLAEKELEFLDRAPYDIRTTTSIDLFGNETTATFNFTEKRRRELKQQIRLLNNNIEAGSNYARLKSVVQLAEQLTSWNPYDQNNHSEFFDPEWMFGLKPDENGGFFDVVIGNPPYIQLQKIKEIANQLKTQNYESFESTGDIYCLFYEKGIMLLKQDGFETLITSSQWLKANYGSSLRKYFMKFNPLILTELGPSVFESATVDSNILLIQKTSYAKSLKGAKVDNRKDIYATLQSSMPDITENSWATMNPNKLSIENKIKLKSKPLKDWKINIYRGVLTGFNDAFIIDESKRQELVAKDSKSAEILRPILRGREIESYYTEWDGGYLVNTHNGIKFIKIEPIDVNNYPVIKNHIDSFAPKVFQRYDQGNSPYNLRNCAYLKEFEKEKLIWKRIGSKLRFTYSNEEIFCLDSTCIATGEKMKYLTAFLNSKICHYQLFEKAPRTGMGDLIISVQALEPLLAFYPNDKQEAQLSNLASQIIDYKKQGKNTNNLELQIDLILYRLYDLSYSEVKIIDPEIESKISEMKYEQMDIE